MPQRKNILLICLCAIGVYPLYGRCDDPAVEFISIPVFRDIQDHTVYDEIMKYSKDKPFGNEYGRSTNAHETVHGINSYLRNQQLKSDPSHKNINGFYAGNGRGIILQNPSIKMQHIIPYIPEKLRSYRYKVYFIKQIQDWNHNPTYIIDEWVCYIFGGLTAIDDHNRKIVTENSDAVSGCLDFSIYAVALCICVKEHNNNYWIEYTQFKSAIKYYLDKAEDVFYKGRDIFKFPEQEHLLRILQTHEDATDIRQFLADEFDGVFLKKK